MSHDILIDALNHGFIEAEVAVGALTGQIRGCAPGGRIKVGCGDIDLDDAERDGLPEMRKKGGGLVAFLCQEDMV